MGCQIGKRTILSWPMQASDWNAVRVGHDCMIGGVLQFHTLENMMLKVKLTNIQDGSAINFGATVMGGAVIGSETTLLPLSMALKEMHLPTATYEGSPAEPVSGVQQASPLVTRPRPGGGHFKMSGEAARNEEIRPTRFTVSDD
jgi:carbonic anhydrase/acetyltransferase-like protein (isoleucine patch superfamily)